MVCNIYTTEGGGGKTTHMSCSVYTTEGGSDN